MELRADRALAGILQLAQRGDAARVGGDRMIDQVDGPDAIAAQATMDDRQRFRGAGRAFVTAVGLGPVELLFRVDEDGDAAAEAGRQIEISVVRRRPIEPGVVD